MTGPALTRQHPPGATSARGQLFTVLGELVLPSGGGVWTSAVIDLLGRLGVEEGATRQALMRVAAGGWLRAEKHGRRTRWHLTPAGERLLVEGTERIYGFAGLADRWDGRWLLVLARIPERDRAARHLVRTRLAWAGLGTPRPGVWVSTHVDRLEEVRGVLGEAGVLGDTPIFVARHEGGGPLTELVRDAWDLGAVAVAYEGFVAEVAGSTDDDPLARLVELVHAWRRFPRIDPALPPELLPAGWPGAGAAALFAHRHAAWVGPARTEWAALNDLHDPKHRDG